MKQWRCDSSDGIVTRLQLGFSSRKGSGRDFFLFTTASSCGAHPASYPMDTGTLSLGGKVAGV